MSFFWDERMYKYLASALSRCDKNMSWVYENCKALSTWCIYVYISRHVALYV